MKPKLDTIKAFIISFCFSLTYATTVLADDTDIYLGDPDAAIIKPNVLFVLDTSDSMSNEVPGTGKDRLANMRDAMTQLVQDLDNVNVGLMRFNGRRTGAIIFPVSDLDANLSVLPSETDLTARSLAFTVSDPNDDASETTDTGAVMLNEASLSINDESTPVTLEIPIASGSDNARANLLDDDSNVGALQLNITNSFKNNYGMGLRFTNLAIPADAQITSAAIKFTARLNGSGVINTIIQGQKDIAPAAFTATDDMEDSGQRPKTSASVSWTPPDFVAAQEYVTDDITPIIEELTDGAAGWVAGSDMVLFVFPVSGDKNAIRQPIRHQDSATLNPRLVINYVLPKQRIATRFQKVNIPQGASITSAYIDFISADPAANQPFPITTQIHAEATDDAAAYSTAPFDISTRTYTGNSVPWTLPAVYTPPLTTNQLITPAADVTSLVQEVVNRPGWCGGNAMAFKFETSQFAGGLKVLKSSDTPTDENNPSGAPVLRVVFDQTAVPPGGGCIRKQLTYQPEHPKDDATQKLSKSKLTLGGELETDNRIVGLRFPGVQLEPDDVIVDAHLELTHILAGTGAIDMTIAGHDAGNLIRFSKFELLNDFLAKPRTTASVPWNIPNDNAQDEKVVSPDLTSIISEIIQDPGNNWSRGNSLGLYLENFTNDRLFHSANTNAALSPRLKLTIETKASSVITVRERMLELINEQTHTLNRTPSIETLLEAAYYWRGENVYYGTHRGQGGFPNGVPNPNDQDTAGDPDLGMNFGRVSHPDSYTGGTLKQSPGCDNTNLDAPECFDEVIDGAPVYNSPMEIGECQNNYMIFLSDGAPTENNEAPALIQAMTGDESCATNSKGNNGACGINLLEYLKEEDQSSTLDGDQTVTT
ncbi:MAG: VWA domain-containing protein, partial [Gammaproteobacteria bacterium]